MKKDTENLADKTKTTIRIPAEDIIKGASEQDQLDRLAENAAKDPVPDEDQIGESPGAGPLTGEEKNTPQT